MHEIKIKREEEWFNKNFEYEIVFNDYEMIELASGEEKIVALEEPVTIQAKLWWCGSEKVTIKNQLHTIKGIEVKANFFTHFIPIFLLPFVFILCAIINIVDPQYSYYLTITVVSTLSICLALLTIFRKYWLKLKLVR